VVLVTTSAFRLKREVADGLELENGSGVRVCI
jgi:hypothetical protein